MATCIKCNGDYPELLSVSGKFGYCIHCAESMAINAWKEEDSILDIEDANGEEYAICSWCEELCPISDLKNETELGYLCENCIEAIRSRGEELDFTN